MAILVNAFYHGDPDQFGVKEAILFSRRIDEWLRYSSVGSVIRKEFPEGCRIVDVGGTPWELAFFLPAPKYRITVVNRSRFTWLHRSGFVNLVHADGRRLPFRDGVFDVAVTIDTLEHIPQEDRQAFIAEMRRIARDAFLLVPADDQEGNYDAGTCDAKLAAFCRNRLGYEDTFFSEHLLFGVPTLEWLRGQGIQPLEGNRSSVAWLSYAPLVRLPLVGYLAGPLYLKQWRSLEGRPPYYSALCQVSPGTPPNQVSSILGETLPLGQPHTRQPPGSN